VAFFPGLAVKSTPSALEPAADRLPNVALSTSISFESREGLDHGFGAGLWDRIGVDEVVCFETTALNRLYDLDPEVEEGVVLDGPIDALVYELMIA
jgi:hypothetical protein